MEQFGSQRWFFKAIVLNSRQIDGCDMKWFYQCDFLLLRHSFFVGGVLFLSHIDTPCGLMDWIKDINQAYLRYVSIDYNSRQIDGCDMKWFCQCDFSLLRHSFFVGGVLFLSHIDTPCGLMDWIKDINQAYLRYVSMIFLHVDAQI